MKRPTILLISADSASRTLLEGVLSNRSATLLTATAAEPGLRSLTQQQDPALILWDAASVDLPPQAILQRIRRIDSRVPVVLIGTDDSAKAAMEAVGLGFAYYLAKPLTVEASETALQHVPLTQEPSPAATDALLSAFDRIVSRSPQMQLVKHLAREVAATDATVLITGESGTGKELFARAIHQSSPRAKGPFIALNCAGIPEHLLESELFGYHQGAFTDAKHNKPGRFQLAEGGTLFLDEIGEMSLAAQAKLLRVLEDHQVEPLGDTHSHKVNIRVIAATNEDLPAQIKAGRFRLDLFYRLNVYQLRIPPLRERLEDLEPILQSFLESTRLAQGHRIRAISPAALALLQRHDWPGNVRELHNVVEGLTITCKADVITPEHLPATFQQATPQSRPQADDKVSLLAFGLSFQEMEKKMLEEALRKASGNVSEASRLLKMTRNTLRYRMAKYHIA